MLAFFKRIAAFGRAVIPRAASTQLDPISPSVPLVAVPEQLEFVAHAEPWAPCFASAMLLNITISKPEPVPHTEHELPPPTIATPEIAAIVYAVAATTSAAAASKRPQALVCQRRVGSPIVANHALARTPRRKKTAPRAPVRSNRASAEQVRMQAALARNQRNRNAARALSRMKALLPTATIVTLPLHRAA